MLFQNVIKPLSKLLWVRHGYRKLHFSVAGCRKPEKVGKHWFSAINRLLCNCRPWVPQTKFVFNLCHERVRKSFDYIGCQTL